MGLRTPRKSSKMYAQADEEDESHQTPLLQFSVEIPAEHCTPEVNWGEIARHLKDDSMEQETPTPMPCGGPQPCLGWANKSPSLGNDVTDRLQLPQRRSFAPPPAFQISPDVAAALGPAVTKLVLEPTDSVWEELMSSAREREEESWKRWLSRPPPCPSPMRIAEPLASNGECRLVNHKVACDPSTPRQASDPSTPRSCAAQRQCTPPPPPRRPLMSPSLNIPWAPLVPPTSPLLGLQKRQPLDEDAGGLCTPRKSSAARETTPPPRSRSPVPPTPARPSPLLMTQAEESLWSSSEEDSPSRGIQWPSSPPRCNLCPEEGDGLEAWLTAPRPAPRGARSRREEDRENQDPNVGRFAREFCEVVTIKDGQYSRVFRAQHKMDQQVYAVKAQKVANELEQQVLLREVAALSAFSTEGPNCPGLLQYYSAWLEDGLLHVQTEAYECSLRDRLQSRIHSVAPPAAEEEVLMLLRDVSAGLAALHARGLAHTDVRPENILVGQQGRFKVAGLSRCCRLSGDVPPPVQLVGHDSPADCRYVAPEALWLGGDIPELPPGDVLSLALVACDLATCPKVLASEGIAWQQLRSGCLYEPVLRPLLSEPLMELLRWMLRSTPRERPRCVEVAVRAGELLLGSSSSAVCEAGQEAHATQAVLAPLATCQKEAELREALRRAREAGEQSRRRAEASRRELDALRCRQEGSRRSVLQDQNA